MGWFPARDANNRVIPENLNFPHPVATDGIRFAGKIKRGSELNRGTPHKKLPSMGSKNEKKHRHYTKLLAEQAMSFGWCNGKRLVRKVTQRAA